MNLKEFIQKWNGELVDFDGRYGYQCVDFARQFCKEVHGLFLGNSGGSAKTMWFNRYGTFDEKWEKIINDPKDPNQTPEPGDIIFWTHGKYGHIGVVVKGFPYSIRVIDQNTGSGNGDGRGNNKIRVHNYSYRGVAGWYRLRKQGETYTEQLERENGILRRRAKETEQALTKALLALQGK